MGHLGAEIRQLPAGRTLLVDERGVGLRATWHHDRGFANLSVWRGDRCVETFHLSVPDAAKLIGFLATGLAEAVEESAALPDGGLTGAPAPTLVDDALHRATAQLRDARRRLSSWLAP